MASVCSILSLLVFTTYILPSGSSLTSLNRPTGDENEVTDVHHRQRRQATCNEAVSKATFPCTRKEFTELRNDHTCVWFSQSRKTFEAAKNTCKRMGSKLVKVDDMELNEALVEKGPSKKWWIGLQWTYGRYGWLGESAPARSFLWRGGVPPKIKPGSSSTCVFMDAGTGGLRSNAPCSDPMFFICQRDSVRRLTRAVLKISGAQNDTERSTTINIGGDLRATCEVYGGKVDNVVFELDDHTSPDWVKIYDRSKKEVHFMPARYEHRSDVCWQITIVTLALPLSIGMDNGTLFCRAILHGGPVVESSKRRIHIQTPAGRPTLNIDFDEEPSTVYAGRDKIKATCSAPIGLSRNSLTWAILNDWGLWKWSSNHRPKPACGYLCVENTFKKSVAHLGLYMYSTLVIYSRFGFEGLTIVCLSYSKEDNKIPRGEIFKGYNPLRAIAGPIRVKTFNPLPPNLTKLFVSQQGEAGVKTKVQCFAFVGRTKALTWFLRSKDGDIREEAVNESGKIISGHLGEGVALVETEVRRLRKGPEILSTLSMAPSSEVDNSTLVCSSHNDSDQRLSELSKSVTFDSRKEVPPMTQFSVSYHKPPSTVYGNRTMKATCTASLGMNGYLTWALRTRLGEALWTVSADGKLNSGGATGVNITARKVGPGEQKDQSVLTSNLSLVVNETLQGGVVTCRSRPGEGPIEVWNVSRHLVVRYLARPPILVVGDVAPSVTWVKKVGPSVTYKEANCSAYVGTHGVLTWLLLSRNTSIRWHFDMMGSLSGVIPDARDERERAGVSVTFHPKLGPRINSSVIIDVTEYPGKAMIICSSDDSPNLEPTNELVAWAYLNAKPTAETSKLQLGGIDGFKWTVIIFILFLLVLSATLYAFLKMKRR